MDKAEDAIMAEMMTSKFRDDHPEAVYFQAPPLLKKYWADVPEPEPLPVRDWNDFELRAFVEKQQWQAKENAVWTQRKQEIGRCAIGHDADLLASLCKVFTPSSHLVACNPLNAATELLVIRLCNASFI